MKFSMLHISDIHFKNENNSLLEKVEKISLAIKSELYDIETLFIVMTGDMAFSGSQVEYEIGVEFLEGLKNSLIKEREINIYIIK